MTSAADDAALDAGGDGMNLLRQPEAVAGHALAAAAPRRPARPSPGWGACAGSTSGSWTWPRPGSSWPIQRPSPTTTITAPDDEKRRARRPPRRPAGPGPATSTSGATVGRGISTESGRRLRRRLGDCLRIARHRAHRSPVASRAHRPTRYTTVNTTTQTPSTKCQYQDTSSTPAWFAVVTWRAQGQAEHDRA